MATPNMNLELPVPTQTIGPLWATQLNEALDLVDAHDHSSGKGSQVPASGLDINGDVNIDGNIFYNFQATRYEEQSATLTGASFINSVYSVNGDLYWTNGSGTAVQITSGGSISAVAGTASVFEYAAVSSNLTIAPSDTFVFLLVNTTASRTITLPAASAVTAGRIYIIKDFNGLSNTNNIVLDAAGADLIDSVGTINLNSNFGSWSVIADGISTWSLV